jgi:hypothetical protein
LVEHINGFMDAFMTFKDSWFYVLGFVRWFYVSVLQVSFTKLALLVCDPALMARATIVSGSKPGVDLALKRSFWRWASTGPMLFDGRQWTQRFSMIA